MVSLSNSLLREKKYFYPNDNACIQISAECESIIIKKVTGGEKISGSTGIGTEGLRNTVLHSTTELPNHMSICLMIYHQIHVPDYKAIHLHLFARPVYYINITILRFIKHKAKKKKKNLHFGLQLFFDMHNNICKETEMKTKTYYLKNRSKLCSWLINCIWVCSLPL